MKKIIIIFVIILIFGFTNVKVLGHEKDLDINHENCIANINENWYLLGNYNPNELTYFGHHFPQNINIKYHIHNQAMKSEYTWTDDISLEIANDIQMSFVNSMLLWNNVYYYSYDELGNRISNKIVNIEEGGEDDDDHNLCIYPIKTNESYAASMNPYSDSRVADTEENTESNSNITTNHYSRYYCNVNIPQFYNSGFNSADDLNEILVLAGAHELGHALGLRDLDKYCSEYFVEVEDDTGNVEYDIPELHHQEMLMGYGDRINNFITYYDIAGV